MFQKLTMKTKKYPSISIIIPAFNEEGNIEWVIKDTLKSLPVFFKDFEIMVIDDGSKDSTGKIIDTLSQNNKYIKVIHQKNGGYSKAMLTGIQKASKEFTAYMPADGQFLIEDMRHCFEVMRNNDLVLGYRGGRPDYTTYRMILSYGYLLLLALLFNFKYIDVGWVNIWNTKKLQKLKLEGAGGIFILTEIVVKFQKLGYKIVEAPSYYRVRRSGEVKNAKFNVVKDTLFNALILWVKLKTNRIT